jgi:hypothetical protein
MGSGAVIYKARFITTGAAIQKFVEGDTKTHRQHGDRTSLLSYFQNKESKPKRK